MAHEASNSFYNHLGVRSASTYVSASWTVKKALDVWPLSYPTNLRSVTIFWGGFENPDLSRLLRPRVDLIIVIGTSQGYKLNQEPVYAGRG